MTSARCSLPSPSPENSNKCIEVVQLNVALSTVHFVVAQYGSVDKRAATSSSGGAIDSEECEHGATWHGACS